MNNIEQKEMLSKKLAFIKQEIELISEKRLRLIEEQKQIDLQLAELVQQAKNVLDEKQELAEIIDFENFKNTGT
jgi:trans-2-enoyl-CoA reductase